MPENENTGELHESPLDPAEDERIRRLLADARHTEPMPEAVVARLDRVLAGLSDDRTERAERADRGRRGRRPRGPPPPDRRPAPRRRGGRRGRGLRHHPGPPGHGWRLRRRRPGGHGRGCGRRQRRAPAATASAFVQTPRVAPEAPPTDRRADAAKSTFRIRSDEFGPDVRRARNQLEGGERRPGRVPRRGLPGRQRRAGQRGRRRDVRRRSRRPGPAPALGRRPGRRPVPLRRPRAAAFDHADRSLTCRSTGHERHSWGRV